VSRPHQTRSGPEAANLQAVVGQLWVEVCFFLRRLFIRRGRWPDEEAGSDPLAAQEPLFASAVAASLQGRLALGPRAGQPVRRLRSAADAIATGRRSARLEGFSLHADVAVPARRRDQLERVCRDILRPSISVFSPRERAHRPPIRRGDPFPPQGAGLCLDHARLGHHLPAQPVPSLLQMGGR
jgi:hypothetical protein